MNNDLVGLLSCERCLAKRPTVALRQVKLLRMLLVALGDKDGDKTGLEKAIRTEDGACTWVCRAAAGTATKSGGSTCYDTFLQHGRSALLIDMALE